MTILLPSGHRDFYRHLRMNKETLKMIKTAWIKSLPIMCSYIFVAMAYGIMMEDAGFPWYDSLFISMTVYTGAFQFVLITFLSSGASLLTVLLTACLMNSRQTFYSLTYAADFKKMGKRKIYMIHTMTDETYAVNCSLPRNMKGRLDIMFFVALFSRIYWMAGAVAGGILGQLLPFDTEGIDFCMTALFLIIFMDQWEHASSHVPALAGLGIAVLCLFLFGESTFMLPALLLLSGLLLLTERQEKA